MAWCICWISTWARVASISAASLGAHETHRPRASFQHVSSTQWLERGQRVKSGMISLAAFLSASSRAPRSAMSLALRAAFEAPPNMPPRTLLAPWRSVLAVPRLERMNSLR